MGTGRQFAAMTATSSSPLDTDQRRHLALFEVLSNVGCAIGWGPDLSVSIVRKICRPIDGRTHLRIAGYDVLYQVKHLQVVPYGLPLVTHSKSTRGKRVRNLHQEDSKSLVRDLGR